MFKPSAHTLLYCLLRQAGVGIVCLLAVGCSVKRDSYQAPTLTMPEQYRQSPGVQAKPVGQVSLAEWWRVLGSEELSRLVDRGLSNNQDVKIATIRVAQAKTQADQAKAGFWPSLRAPIGMSVGSTSDLTVGLSTSYRSNIWGEQSALFESAQYQLWRSAFERDNIQRSIVTGIVATYIEYLTLNDRLRIARESEALLVNMLSTMETRTKIGDASSIELEQQKAALYASQSAVNTVLQQRENTINSLATLLGTFPSQLKLSEAGLDVLQTPLYTASLPSALLLRRPDIRIVEARLLAADANIDVARARILPNLDLSAQLGTSASLSRILHPSAIFWSALASLSVSIFDGDRLKSQREAAELQYEEMVETYARTVYQAVREVENALMTIRLSEQRLRSQQNITNSAHMEWDSSAQMYKMGSLDYLTLLNSEQQWQRQLDELQRLKMEHIYGYVSLFHALGGGVKVATGSEVSDLIASASLPPGAAVVKQTQPGVDWGDESIDDDQTTPRELFWQVELPGMVHRGLIAPTWRDLRVRFPKLMENRIVRARLQGKIEPSLEGQTSWYRLYIGKFTSPTLAHEFCTTLKANYQRCRVVSSQLEEVALGDNKK